MTDNTEIPDTDARKILFQNMVAVRMRDAVEPHVWDHMLSSCESSIRAGLARELARSAYDVRWRQALIGLSWRAMIPGPDPNNPGFAGTEVPWEPGEPIPDRTEFLRCRAIARLLPDPPEQTPVSYPAPIFTEEGKPDA